MVQMRTPVGILFPVFLLSACGGGGGGGGGVPDEPSKPLPMIVSFSPAMDAQVPAGEEVLFQVNLDPEGGGIPSYTWTVDGALQAAAGPSLSLLTAPGDPDLRTIELKVSSGGAGWTSLVWNLQVLKSAQPDVPASILSTFPASPLSLTAGESIDLSVNAMDPDTADTLTYRWSVDGQPEVLGGPVYTLDSGALAPEDHTVEVRVNDGKTPRLNSAKSTWTVQVQSSSTQNHPPRIKSVQPTKPVRIAIGSSIILKVTARDPDQDPLTYRWDVNGSPTPEAGSTFTFVTSAPGDFRVQVTVSDGRGGQASFTWTITVQAPLPAPDQPPVIVSTNPGATPQILEGESIGLEVQAIDPDGDLLSYLWEIDGSPQAGAGPTFIFDGTAAGDHQVRVTVSDGRGGQAAFTWTITVLTPLPAPQRYYLAWDPLLLNQDGTPCIDLGGFKLHIGSESGRYGPGVDVGNVLESAIDLLPGVYYCTVSAYDMSGNESAFSPETVVVVP